MKLLELFKAMQGMASRYLDPAVYIDRDGQTSRVAAGSDQAVRDRLFTADMLYMLDGPEQREAQAEAETLANHGYPTEDAYLSACRALHWRNAQLKAYGIEPLDLNEVNRAGQLTHYPPEDFDFGVPAGPRVGDGSGDAALAIGEHAFKAGYQKANDEIGSYAVPEQMEAAWSEYDPPEHIKALA